MLYEAGVLREIVLFAMLKYKQTTLLEQAAVQDDVGQLRYLRQGVRGIGKDEVELLATLCYILKDIATDGQCCCFLQLVEKLLNETMVACIEFHTDNSAAASADEFERNAAGTGEKVEGSGAVAEVDIGLQDIEKVLLREICGGTC